MQQKQQAHDLPRFYKDFIGIGHQLEQKRKHRRKIQLQERAVANRVLFLEKEEIRAQKNLIKKRDQLGQILQIAQRQAHDKEMKQRQLLQRQRDIQRAKQENHLRRIMHRQNQERHEQEIRKRNSYDYKLSKLRLIQGETRKKQERREDLISRQERYVSLNISKEQGRSRIDKFFKQKNLEHTITYKQKIRSEEGKAQQKLDTINKLTQIEGVMRKRLEQSSMRVSQIDQIIGNFTQTLKDKSRSRLSLSKTFDNSPQAESPSLITSVEGELLGKLQVQQNGQDGTGSGGASEGGRVRKRRRNKQTDRYKQYDLF